jgi:hypothetical protein
MSEFENIHPHPEWKRLLEAMESNIHGGVRRLYTYEELNAMAGIDLCSQRGRQQFHRFAKEALVKYSVHFENVRTEGYRMVNPNEHGNCAVVRVKRASRQMKSAKRIGSNVDYSGMSQAAITIHTDLMTRLSLLTQTVSAVLRPLRKIAQAVQDGRLPHPLRVDGPPKESVEGKKKSSIM